MTDRPPVSPERLRDLHALNVAMHGPETERIDGVGLSVRLCCQHCAAPVALPVEDFAGVCGFCGWSLSHQYTLPGGRCECGKVCPAFTVGQSLARAREAMFLQLLGMPADASEAGNTTGPGGRETPRPLR